MDDEIAATEASSSYRRRAGLGSWPGILEDLTEDEQWLYRDAPGRWLPALQARISLDHAYAVEYGQPSTVPPPDYRLILGDLVLENYMLSRIDTVHYLLLAYGDLRGLVVEIRDLIDRSLDG